MRFPKPKREAKTPKRIARRVHVKRVSTRHGRVVKADAEWALKVRAEYGDRCFHFWCHNPATDTHHIIGKKAHPQLRYDVENGLPMCREHHDEAHAKPRWSKENFAGWYSERWARLQAMVRAEAA